MRAMSGVPESIVIDHVIRVATFQGGHAAAAAKGLLNEARDWSPLVIRRSNW